MQLPIGKLNKLVTFERRTGTQESTLGTSSYVWADVLPLEWAEVQEMLPSRGERIAEGINIAARPARIRCRYRGDITNDMRVKFDGRTLKIVGGPAELGRREGLEMVCEELSTEGVEA